MEDETPSSIEPDVEALAQAVDVVWVFFSLILVVLMQAGFASYEVSLSGGRRWPIWVW